MQKSKIEVYKICRWYYLLNLYSYTQAPFLFLLKVARIMEHIAKIIKSSFVHCLTPELKVVRYLETSVTLPDDTTLHPRRLDSSAVSLWKAQISQHSELLVSTKSRELLDESNRRR
jgi:hypothetical protein